MCVHTRFFSFIMCACKMDYFLFFRYCVALTYNNIIASFSDYDSIRGLNRMYCYGLSDRLSLMVGAFLPGPQGPEFEPRCVRVAAFYLLSTFDHKVSLFLFFFRYYAALTYNNIIASFSNSIRGLNRKYCCGLSDRLSLMVGAFLHGP